MFAPSATTWAWLMRQGVVLTSMAMSAVIRWGLVYPLLYVERCTWLRHLLGSFCYESEMTALVRVVSCAPVVRTLLLLLTVHRSSATVWPFTHVVFEGLARARLSWLLWLGTLRMSIVGLVPLTASLLEDRESTTCLSGALPSAGLLIRGRCTCCRQSTTSSFPCGSLVELGYAAESAVYRSGESVGYDSVVVTG